jgi:hypothetical protein
MDINRKFYIKQGDLLPALAGTFVDETTGAPQSLMGVTTLTFHMRNGAGEVVVSAAANVVDAAAGTFRYDWMSGDTAVAGVFEGEIEAIFTDRPLTGPNTRNFLITIMPEIA